MHFPPITTDGDIFADGGCVFVSNSPRNPAATCPPPPSFFFFTSMDTNCPAVEAPGVAEQLFTGEPLEVLLSLGAGSFGPAITAAHTATTVVLHSATSRRSSSNQ